MGKWGKAIFNIKTETKQEKSNNNEEPNHIHKIPFESGLDERTSERVSEWKKVWPWQKAVVAAFALISTA